MSETVFSILLVIVGLFVGVFAMFIVNYIKGATAESKAEKMLANAKVEAEKIKRDSILETKEDYKSFEDYISIWDCDYGFWELGLPPVLTHDGEINIIHDDEVDKLSEYDESIM